MFEHFSRLDDTQKKSVIQMLKSFLKGGEITHSRQTLKEYNEELDEAMVRVKEGKFTTLEDLEKEMRSW